MWCVPPACVVLEEGYGRVDEHTVCECLADPVLHLDDDAGAVKASAVDVQGNLSGGGERDADVVREEFDVDDVPSREEFVEEPDEEVLVGFCSEGRKTYPFYLQINRLSLENPCLSVFLLSLS